MNKKRTNLPMPHIDIPPIDDDFDLKHFPQNEKWKDIKKKYVSPVIQREKDHKKQLRKEWWWTKGATILNIILALIAAVTGIISLLK